MVNNPTPITHILVPTDGSHPSVHAGRLAVQLAAFHQASVTFVYVIDQSIAMELANASGKELKQVQDEMEQSAERSLDYLARLAIEMEVVAKQAIRHGIPYNEIAALAQEQNVDLIAIGKIESRSPRRSMMGSITEQIIEHSPCPVLVVK